MSIRRLCPLRRCTVRLQNFRLVPSTYSTYTGMGVLEWHYVNSLTPAPPQYDLEVCISFSLVVALFVGGIS